MKKVLFVATVDSHIKHFHVPYLKWFQEQGYEVHVATNGESAIEYCDIRHTITFERTPIKLNNIKAIKQLKQLIEQEKFDIIHCHTPMGSVVTRLAAKKARKKYHTKVIYTAHGFHFFKGAGVLNWLVYYPIEYWLSYVTDCLITINQEDYALAKKKFKAKKIKFVNGVGVDKSRFCFEMPIEQQNDLRKSLGIEEQDFVMIYTAELSKRKNQEMLIKAIYLLVQEGYKQVKLLLPGPDKENGFHQKLVNTLGLENNVLLLGYRTDIEKLNKIVDLAVSTSKHEGLPINVVEVMMSGLPILVTDCRGNRDLAMENGNNLIPFNENVLKELIEQFMKGNLSITDKDMTPYELNTVLKEMEKIYQEVILDDE